MRTGGGVGPPGHRPLPPTLTPEPQLAPPQLSGARLLTLARALAPPPRHVTGGPTGPESCAPLCNADRVAALLWGTRLFGQPSEDLGVTYSHLGHQRRSRPQSLPEKRGKPIRTDGACPPAPDSGVGGRWARGRAGK